MVQLADLADDDVQNLFLWAPYRCTAADGAKTLHWDAAAIHEPLAGFHPYEHPCRRLKVHRYQTQAHC